MCTVLLPPGVNPVAVNKYINICSSFASSLFFGFSLYLYSFHISLLFAALDDRCLVLFDGTLLAAYNDVERNVCCVFEC